MIKSIGVDGSMIKSSFTRKYGRVILTLADTGLDERINIHFESDRQAITLIGDLTAQFLKLRRDEKENGPRNSVFDNDSV